MTLYRNERLALICAIACTLAGSASAGQAQTRLLPPAQRISDEAIAADLQGYQAVQDRIRGLNDRGRPLRDYALSKAQCWLDVSFHEYTRNDRSDFPQAALGESEKLVVLMEQGSAAIPTDTPWSTMPATCATTSGSACARCTRNAGFSCAQQAAACGEVELVHAGNEFNQQQWRHAKPYIQIAEDLLNDAEAQARQCAVAAPVAAAAAEPTVLVANVLFEFDGDGDADIRTYSLESLDRAFARIAEEGLTLQRVELVGHADRMDGRGHDYNQGLSERRARTVRGRLLGKGVAADKITYSYRGDGQQVQQCAGVKPRGALLECLLPNRRVEVRLVVGRAEVGGG